MLQNARVIAFTVSELLKGNQQGLFLEEGVKLPQPYSSTYMLQIVPKIMRTSMESTVLELRISKGKGI